LLLLQIGVHSGIRHSIGSHGVRIVEWRVVLCRKDDAVIHPARNK
jgi:hypothetical protein